ncbi:DUF4149 domain-containing protein [Tautonia plasticadhaerens]|uniref:TMEM205-like domain-containing protein n=1 Tax=Tautonia plasticadhaerens TaxID=2527974 RepID=A0A518HB37_9BACT|nr:DUF4149 domain-containing protein [Tautonia plasticadhaerens]QDV38074.1 hypothetical protein ElP_60220 [Tautonia plasticadhaerens]
MDARILLMALDALFLLGMTAWLGAILFVSFGVAPIIFTILDPSQAARFVRALFPRYYAWGATSATIALASFTGGVLVLPEYRGTWALAQIMVLLGGILINLHCGNVLTPRINAARDAGPEQADRFARLHRRSVRLNGLMMLAGVALVVAHASRPEPTGPGVTEPTPSERALRGVERWEGRHGGPPRAPGPSNPIDRPR